MKKEGRQRTDWARVKGKQIKEQRWKWKQGSGLRATVREESERKLVTQTNPA